MMNILFNRLSRITATSVCVLATCFSTFVLAEESSVSAGVASSTEAEPVMLEGVVVPPPPGPYASRLGLQGPDMRRAAWPGRYHASPRSAFPSAAPGPHHPWSATMADTAPATTADGQQASSQTGQTTQPVPYGYYPGRAGGYPQQPPPGYGYRVAPRGYGYRPPPPPAYASSWPQPPYYRQAPTPAVAPETGDSNSQADGNP